MIATCTWKNYSGDWISHHKVIMQYAKQKTSHFQISHNMWQGMSIHNEILTSWLLLIRLYKINSPSKWLSYFLESVFWVREEINHLQYKTESNSINDKATKKSFITSKMVIKIHVIASLNYSLFGIFISDMNCTFVSIVKEWRLWKVIMPYIIDIAACQDRWNVSRIYLQFVWSCNVRIIIRCT